MPQMGSSLDWGLNIIVEASAGNWTMTLLLLISQNATRKKTRIGFDGLEMFPSKQNPSWQPPDEDRCFNQYIETGCKAVIQGSRRARGSRDDEYIDDFAGDDTPAHTRYRSILHFTERDIIGMPPFTLVFLIALCTEKAIALRREDHSQRAPTSPPESGS